MASNNYDLRRTCFLYFLNDNNTQTPTIFRFVFFAQYSNVNLSFNIFLYMVLCYSKLALELVNKFIQKVYVYW